MIKHSLYSSLFCFVLTACGRGDPTDASLREYENTEYENTTSTLEGPGLTLEPSAEGDALDVGNGLTFGEISYLSIAYNESLEGVCDSPNYMGFVVSDDTIFPRVYLNIPFYGEPSGEYAARDTLYGPASDDGEQAQYGISFGYTMDQTSEVTYATSGQIVVSVDSRADTAEITFSNIKFVGDSDSSYDGTIILDYRVGCVRLVEYPEDESDRASCGWMPEHVPYTSTFCQDITADYPADVLR